MSVTVKIPTQLRPSAEGKSELKFEGVATLREVIEKIRGDYPTLVERVLDESGEIRKFVNVFVGDEDARFMSGLDTAVEDNQIVSILPAVAGG